MIKIFALVMVVIAVIGFLGFVFVPLFGRNKEIPECYGEYFGGNTQAERDCCSCCLECGCMQATRDRRTGPRTTKE